jgi:hypothetical protein
MCHRRIIGAVLPAVLLASCQREGNAGRDVARGRGLQVATLPAATRARVYEAAARASFDPGPSLTLLLHPRLLPSTAGYAGGQPVPADVAAALRQRAVVRGTCEPPADDARRTPTCTARTPGYVVRFSDIFQSGPDSVQVHFAAERYDTPTSGAHEVFRFERVYQLVNRRGTWRVVREARVSGGDQ